MNHFILECARGTEVSGGQTVSHFYKVEENTVMCVFCGQRAERESFNVSMTQISSNNYNPFLTTVGIRS